MIIVWTLSLIVIAVPLFAQGQGKGSGSAAPRVQTPTGNAGKSDAQTSGKTDTGKTHEQTGKTETGKTHEQMTVASRIEANDKLASRVKLMLPAGMSITDAAAGFKNEGQFIAALHVSQNLNIPFDQVKAKMTGTDGMSLGAAIHALRPDLPADQTKNEVKKAEAQTKTTTSTGTNAKSTTTKK